MSEELKDNCGVCTAFHTDRSGRDPQRVVTGRCRAKSPVAPNTWPKVKSDDWCRESFKADDKHKAAKMRAAKGKKHAEGTSSED